VSAPRTLLVLLFVVVSTRVAEVPQQYVSSQPGGWWDEQPTTPMPVEGLADSDRAVENAADEASTEEVAVDEAATTPEVQFDAERVHRIPVREPAALPNDTPAPLAAETRRPVPLPVSEPTADVASAEPLPEAAAPPVTASAVPTRTGTVATRAETVYYEIEGLSRGEITAALRAHGPNVRGQQFFGLTEWEMSAGYLPAEVEDGCAIDDLTVQVAIKTHLPRWPSDAVASEALSGAWKRFITALDEHEQGHRVLAEEAAETVRHRLLAISAPTCDRLDGVARREMAVVMQEYERRQLAYDAETGHGRTQGAVWPPVHDHQLSARRSR